MRQLKKNKCLLNIIISHSCVLTGSDEGINGNTVILVLFVGISASQAEASEECAEKVKDEANDDQSRCSSQVTYEKRVKKMSNKL